MIVAEKEENKNKKRLLYESLKKEYEKYKKIANDNNSDEEIEKKIIEENKNIIQPYIDEIYLLTQQKSIAHLSRLESEENFKKSMDEYNYLYQQLLNAQERLVDFEKKMNLCLKEEENIITLLQTYQNKINPILISEKIEKAIKNHKSKQLQFSNNLLILEKKIILLSSEI